MKWVPGLSGKKQISKLGPPTADPSPRPEGWHLPAHIPPLAPPRAPRPGGGESPALPLYGRLTLVTRGRAAGLWAASHLLPRSARRRPGQSQLPLPPRLPKRVVSAAQSDGRPREPRNAEKGPSCPQNVQVARLSCTPASGLSVTPPVPQSLGAKAGELTGRGGVTGAGPRVAAPAATYSC